MAHEWVPSLTLFFCVWVPGNRCVAVIYIKYYNAVPAVAAAAASKQTSEPRGTRTEKQKKKKPQRSQRFQIPRRQQRLRRQTARQTIPGMAQRHKLKLKPKPKPDIDIDLGLPRLPKPFVFPFPFFFSCIFPSVCQRNAEPCENNKIPKWGDDSRQMNLIPFFPPSLSSMWVRGNN